MTLQPQACWAAIALTFCLQSCATPAGEAPLRFGISEADIHNEFIRQGPAAAHVVLKSGPEPRIIVAFPAGNSGVGVWFDSKGVSANWSDVRKLRPVSMKAGSGAVRRGVSFEVEIDAGRLEVKEALLSNIRVLRDYEHSQTVPEEITAAPRMEHGKIVWERRRLDGGPGYFLSIETADASVGADMRVALNAGQGKSITLRVTALTGDRPLTSVSSGDLLTDAAGTSERLRNALAFLSYEEKFLAGSWRFNTYFGRDTLMSLALLGPALTPTAVENGLRSVLDRLNDAGEVAHEEDIGEYALLTRRWRGEPSSDSPILDYSMVDDDFMLLPTLAAYLLERVDGRDRAAGFLARRSPGGAPYGALILRNLEFVIESARPFADSPHFSRLIRVKSDDPPVGNWRDSREGLGGGVFPYDINAALVPAALDAARRLGESGLLDSYSQKDVDWTEVPRLAAAWSKNAPLFFDVSISETNAHERFDDLNREISFPALALDRRGAPIPVMHSDVGYLLLFGDPAPDDLDRVADLLLRPYPSGLMTPVGMLVANAAYAPPDTSTMFDKTRYHGAVVWSWQQALMAAGLQRQLGRRDLPDETRASLGNALAALRQAISVGSRRQTSELWSWAFDDGEYSIAPFGQNPGDETESNAAQLWSTVYLGIGDY